MKIKKNKSIYKLPHYYQIVSVCLDQKEKDPQGVRYMLMQVPAYDLGEEAGIPTRFALYENKIQFYPVPDANMEVVIEFTELKQL